MLLGKLVVICGTPDLLFFKHFLFLCSQDILGFILDLAFEFILGALEGLQLTVPSGDFGVDSGNLLL